MEVLSVRSFGRSIEERMQQVGIILNENYLSSIYSIDRVTFPISDSCQAAPTLKFH